MPAYGDLLQISRHICRVEWASIDRPFVGLDLVNILLQNEGYRYICKKYKLLGHSILALKVHAYLFSRDLLLLYII